MKRSGFKKKSYEEILASLKPASRRKTLKKSGLRAIGKRGKINQKANRILAATFKGPQYCEATFPHDCTGSEALTWAHNAKRRKKPDLLHAALLCRNAHDCIEYLPPEEMKRHIDEIVAARDAALPHAA